MIEYLLIAGVIAVMAVAAVVFFFKVKAIPAIVIGLVVIFGLNPLTYNVGSEIAKDQASTFNEYWNGFETATIKSERTCTIDGSCYHTYDCDPYQVPVTRTTTNSKGETKTTIEMETRYRSCPYSTQETSYYVDSTIERFTIAANVMTGPEFRAYEHRIPGGRQGEPALWTEAKARIDAGKAGPVTAVKTYKNYILASQKSLFSSYSDRIDALKEKNLLPTPASGAYAIYQSDKAYKVAGANVPGFAEYVKDVAYLNGAVGDDLHGDLHVVFAPADIEGGKTDYMNALLAYWQSAEHGRNALSKNAVLVVVGVSGDGSKAEWAMSATGMPVGNEAMMTQISSDMAGKPMGRNLLGRPEFNPTAETFTSSNGVLESILWGENAFERVSMTANDSEDKGSGFMYLRDELRPDGWALFFISLVNILLAGGFTVGVLALIIKEIVPSDFIHWAGHKERTMGKSRNYSTSPHSSVRSSSRSKYSAKWRY